MNRTGSYSLLFALLIPITFGAFEIPGDDETDVDLLVPLQNLIGTDPRVFRTKGLDGLPAVGLQRGVEIVTPYRAHLPRMFFRDFAFLASIKPSDDRGGFLFAVLNAFDTVVDLGVKLEAAVDSQTNISLLYTDSEVESTSRVIASFVVPAFTNQWTQIAIEVKDDTVALYFRCMRYATRQVRRQPPQLQMDDATKLYIGSAGMIVGGGFEGSIQELKIYSDPMEATRQCDQEWADEGSGSYLVPSTRPTIEVPTSRRPEPEITTQPKPPVNLEETRFKPPPSVNTINQIKGEKGDRGDRGYPGVCEQRCDQTGPMGPQGLRGPPGTFDGLSDSDIARIASWPGVKGEKGDAGQANDRGPSYETNILPTDDQPAYDNRPLRYGAATAVKGEPGQKGQKGEQGLPGPAAPQQRPIERPANELGGGVRVYQTTVELLSSAPQTHVGSLAFSLSDQQLYLRVNNGWQSVKLGEFHASIQRRPSAPITLADFSAKDHLAYWVNDMSGDGKEFETVPCVRRSTEVLDSVTEERQLPPDEWRARQPPMPVTEPAQPARHHHPSHSHGAHSQLPSHDVEWRDRYRYDLHDEISNSRPLEHEKKLHMIALNEPLRGDMGGVRGADLECYRQAREAGYHTTFRAFLSSRVQDLAKMVYPDDRTTPVFNSRGERIFDTWSSIFEGGIHSTGQIYSFNGRNIFDDNLYNDRWLWHGSTQHGNRDGTFCDLWRSSNGAHSGAASPISFGKPLTFGPRPVPCYRRLVVLCVENMSKYNVDRRVGKRIPNYDFDHLD
ncbi:hypothetical protein M3Y95_00721100 [Aphelenchoides besseyi]|nr:hypothetical protein M3Y95_00721100 [Aphelenchoides besseyi]